jgi:hypothetical protein
LKIHSLLPILISFLGLSFGTFAQSKDELKLKSFYNEGNFDKCFQFCEKLEKSKDPRVQSLIHLYAALSCHEMILDEQFWNSSNKKPIRTVAVEISRYLKTAPDSLKSSHAILENKVVRSLENVIVNNLELKKLNDAKYLAGKLHDGDTLNIGAANVLDFIALVEGAGKNSDRVSNLLTNGFEMTPKYQSFFTETTVIYAAWLVKEGKSDSAMKLAKTAAGLVGENELLEIFK